MDSLSLETLNRMASDEAAALLRCCGSRGWVDRMLEHRPFSTIDELMMESDRAWRALPAVDQLEAFRAHPRIGEAPEAGTDDVAARWSSREQEGARSADTATAAALASGNAEYDRRFGHLFIVCATGKSADELLALLEARLSNPPEVEFAVAAEEQRKITRLRLQKLFEPEPLNP
jgi:OHCU decarboxylase